MQVTRVRSSENCAYRSYRAYSASMDAPGDQMGLVAVGRRRLLGKGKKRGKKDG